MWTVFTAGADWAKTVSRPPAVLLCSIQRGRLLGEGVSGVEVKDVGLLGGGCRWQGIGVMGWGCDWANSRL